MSGTTPAPFTTDAPAAGPPHRRTLLALLCTGLFVVYLDTTVVSVALPAVRADLGGDISTLQWVVDAYVLTFACLLLSAGALGDLLGRRRVFLIGLIGFTIASAACALAPSAGLLLAARAVQGVFGAALVPVSLALVVGLYAQPAERARAIGVWAGTGGLALAAGPVVGGLLTENLGWASVFWLNVPIGVIVTVALFRLLPPVAALPDRRLDVVGQLAFVVGIGALTWSLIESGSRGWGSILVVSGLVIAAAALIFFVVWEGRCAAPMLPLDLIRQPVVAIACVANLFSISGFYIALFLLTLHLQVVQGLSAVETGVRFLAMTGAVMVASFVASSVAGRVGARIPAVAGALSATAGLLGLLTVDASSGYLSYAWALARRRNLLRRRTRHSGPHVRRRSGTGRYRLRGIEHIPPARRDSRDRPRRIARRHATPDRTTGGRLRRRHAHGLPRGDRRHRPRSSDLARPARPTSIPRARERTLGVRAGNPIGEHMPTITGVSPVALSVRNLDSAETWYRGLFDAALVLSGRNEVLGFDYRYLLVPGAELLIGLIRHDHAKDDFDHERGGCPGSRGT